MRLQGAGYPGDRERGAVARKGRGFVLALIQGGRVAPNPANRIAGLGICNREVMPGPQWCGTIRPTNTGPVLTDIHSALNGPIADEGHVRHALVKEVIWLGVLRTTPHSHQNHQNRKRSNHLHSMPAGDNVRNGTGW